MTPAEVFKGYYDSIVSGDMERLGGYFADSIVWHQPGNGPLSGEHRGRDAVMALLGEFMTRSQGTFKLVPLDVMENGDSVAVTVRFSAKRPGRSDMDMTGVDVLHVADGQITQMWLYSQNQKAEDDFWS